MFTISYWQAADAMAKFDYILQTNSPFEENAGIPELPRACSPHSLTARPTSPGRMPSNPEATALNSDAKPQQGSSHWLPLPTPLLLPSDSSIQYGSYPSFLHKADIKKHWDDPPIVISPSNSRIAVEIDFLDAIGRVSVDETHAQHITKGSVIDFSGLDNQELKYFATYTNLMDGKHAYIRLVAYSQFGERCHASHILYGNRILVVPRSLNDVPFPSQLSFHAYRST
jgi:hypothetical protein